MPSRDLLSIFFLSLPKAKIKVLDLKMLIIDTLGDAKKQFKKTNYVFKRKSNAGRPPKNGAQENEF